MKYELQTLIKMFFIENAVRKTVINHNLKCFRK